MKTENNNSLTAAQRRMICALYNQLGNIELALEEAGVSRQNHSNWLKENRSYLRACRRKLNSAQNDFNALVSRRICEAFRSGDKEAIAATRFVYDEQVINRVLAGEIVKFNYLNIKLFP